MKRNLVDEAWEIVSAKVLNGTASGGDRACYYILGRSAFRLLPGPWNAETQRVAEHLQESLAFTVVMHEKSPKACDRCGVPFKLISECEEDGCVDPGDESADLDETAHRILENAGACVVCEGPHDRKRHRQ